MDKSSSLGMPMSPQEISKKCKRQILGMPKASLSSSTTYQVISSETILLLSHHMYFTWSVCLFLFSCIFCNKLGRILTFLCGRETRSAFSCEYSYSSLIFVKYSLLVFMLPAPVFHASLVQSC